MDLSFFTICLRILENQWGRKRATERDASGTEAKHQRDTSGTEAERKREMSEK
jgi:hypothetical protein